MNANLVFLKLSKELGVPAPKIKMALANIFRAEKQFEKYGTTKCIICSEELTYEKTYSYCLSVWDSLKETDKRFLASMQGGLYVGNRKKDPRHYYAHQYAIRKCQSGACLECRDKANAITPAGNMDAQRFFQSLRLLD